MRELPGAQQSDRWLKNRLGRITGSRICDVMNYLKKGGESAARRNYRMELIAERLTNRAADHYTSPEMIRGSEMESEARSRYELAAKVMIEPVGFVLHPKYDFTGASPDGLIGDDGIYEAKCPKSETLLAWLDSETVPEEYIYQVQWELACTEREWCDFHAHDDRLPAEVANLVIRAYRDEGMIQAIENEVVKMNEEIEEFIARRGLPRTIWQDAAPEEEVDPDLVITDADYPTAWKEQPVS